MQRFGIKFQAPGLLALSFSLVCNSALGQTVATNSSGSSTVTSSAALQTSNTSSGDLTVSKNSNLIVDFGSNSNLSISGNLSNFGNIYALSTNPHVTTANISALNISNNVGAHITTVLPASISSQFAYTVPNFNLSLVAINNVMNAGAITSAGALNVSAGGSIINALPTGVTGPSPIMQAFNNVNLMSGSGAFVNAGLISSIANNVNLTSQGVRDITVNNSAGLIEAINGRINVRDMAFSGNSNISILGGDLKASALDLFSGCGAVNLDVGSILGTLNVSAGETHTTVSYGNLQLGNIQLGGDPTFYNTGGDVQIGGDLVFPGQALAIVARGNIVTVAGAGKIDTSSATGGGDITMIAGADFITTGASSVGTSGSGSNATLTISGSTPAGGKIDLSGITSFDARGTASNSNGGKITMLAYVGYSPAADAGTIIVPSNVTIKSGGSGTGNNGSVLIAAGSEYNYPSNINISLGSIDARGGTGLAGDVVIATTGNLHTSTPYQISNSK